MTGVNKALIYRAEVTQRVDHENQTIELECIDRVNALALYHYKQVIKLKDEKIRQGLIELGWTPPKEKENGNGSSKK